MTMAPILHIQMMSLRAIVLHSGLHRFATKSLSWRRLLMPAEATALESERDLEEVNGDFVCVRVCVIPFILRNTSF